MKKSNLSYRKLGKIICFLLAIFDLILGSIAVFFPTIYVLIFHPNIEFIPFDFIIRTGILWLMFSVFQTIAIYSKDSSKWFFFIGIIRIMEVPADISYSILAIGSPIFSKILIASAPIMNLIIGIIMVKLSKKLSSENVYGKN